jgi:hypothetical protein
MFWPHTAIIRLYAAKTYSEKEEWVDYKFYLRWKYMCKKEIIVIIKCYVLYVFFPPFAATAPIWALAYLHETLCFTSVY